MLLAEDVNMLWAVLSAVGVALVTIGGFIGVVLRATGTYLFSDTPREVDRRPRGVIPRLTEDFFAKMADIHAAVMGADVPDLVKRFQRIEQVVADVAGPAKVSITALESLASSQGNLVVKVAALELQVKMLLDNDAALMKGHQEHIEHLKVVQIELQNLRDLIIKGS